MTFINRLGAVSFCLWSGLVVTAFAQTPRAEQTIPSQEPPLSSEITSPVCDGAAWEGGAPECQRLGQCFFDRWEEYAKQTRAKGGRWAQIEYDFDSRGFNVLNFMGSTPLPYGFTLFGFIDIEGDDLVTAQREDLSRFFLEIDLKKSLWERGGVLVEYNDLQGAGNEIGRLGLYHQTDWKFLSPTCGLLAGKSKLGFKFFPLETDRQGGQFSFYWNKNFDHLLGGRLSAGGFFDLNYDVGPTGRTVIVTEHQIRYRVVEGLHVITEFRWNQFLPDDFGIAPGVQYRF